jgi:hypothetical protein
LTIDAPPPSPTDHYPPAWSPAARRSVRIVDDDGWMGGNVSALYSPLECASVVSDLILSVVGG